MPNSTPNCCDTALPIISPMRVILKAVFLMASEISVKLGWSSSRRATSTTPGPLTPTFITHSGSPMPWKAPAMKGLSSGAFAKTTSFAQPIPSLCAVRAAVLLITSPIKRTAVHIDAGLRRGDVYRRANLVGARESLRDRVDEAQVAGRRAFMDQGAEPPDKIHADGLGGRVQGPGDGYIVGGFAAFGHDRNGGHRYSLVDHGNAIEVLDLVRHADEVLRARRDLLVDVFIEDAHIAVGAVPQAQAHGSRCGCPDALS